MCKHIYGIIGSYMELKRRIRTCAMILKIKFQLHTHLVKKRLSYSVKISLELEVQ